ncbi:LOW QUALITY PROTEIN: exocyst complex component 3-like [Homalodisca vitripennis]|uniref:Exocyst complex component 3 n=1 Tax=Homalodisca liturata TaxID=320908 RepID=A0A1B6IED0_9HEMI|nr:LOW QUALITY PROTEIN: exocyst complex component 3-like [Homalodisca vitripennis]KAG8300590.1 Exocyst complex component 3 [Homalodisca vitripennis]
MDIEKLENEAKAAAAKHVINMLQRPGQLEKVDQFKRRVSRKKISVEAMLKTAMQSQLDGVCVGLNQLSTALQDIQEIRQNLKEINDSFVNIPELGNKLNEVRNKNITHSQFVTAMENLKHLFTVPESVEKTKQWISEGKLLHAHQSLMDLENSRDDLLYELHKISNQKQADKILLKAYFEEVEEVSLELAKQLRLVLSRTLNTVRKEPTVIVTALRIIEREEKADEFAQGRYSRSNFMPPGRPKEWRKMAMEVLQESVSQRIEGTQVDERENNKMWLVMHLELTRQLILEDLRVVKTLCGPCFPPHYNIVNEFVSMYHNCLSRHLEEIIQNGLEGNEYVSVLSWIVNTYTGPELMQHPELNIGIASVGPLLGSSVINKLQHQYLSNMEANYIDWMQKTLETEKHDWLNGIAPEGDQDGFFRTAAPVIIFQMIDQNLQVTKTISQALTHKAMVLSMDQVAKYGIMYREAIREFKTRHFEDRSKVPFFTHYMITIVNNCLLFVEHAQLMKQHYWRSDFSNDESNFQFNFLLKTYQDLRDEAAQFLLEEAFLDLDSHFQDLITTKWITSTIPVDTICVTLDDYFQDYGHLRVKNFESVISEAENLVARRYISAMLQKKVTFKTYEERRAAGNKILKEVNQIKTLFCKIAPKLENRVDSPLETIKSLAEVLKSEDLEILSLDLHSLVDKYPDITEDQLSRLLSLRGDLSRSDIREKLSYIFQDSSGQKNTSFVKSIFDQILL